MVRERLQDGVLWLTLDNPERLNAFRGEDYRDLHGAFARATTDDAVRVVVLTGTGRAFSAGADRSLIDGTASADERRLASEEFAALLEAMGRCDTPVIAAVNGLAVGFGCTILLHCDLVLMAETARVRLPFTALGIVPEAGSSVLLPDRARWGDAAWTMLSSEWVDAPGALTMGLAWRAVPDGDLVAEAEGVAATLAAHDPASVAATKRLLVQGRADVVRAAMERENAESRLLRCRPDTTE
jgi:enoyl-CoA hydratase/carnithine racemase